MRKYRIAIVLFLAAALSLQAQEYRTRTVTPYQDSLAIRELRSRLNSIRRSQNRPTIALVLSGGGAKGASHVGVLRYLEEQGIPVDAVFGTSMGGLVGGLYALGYNAPFLDSLLTGMDWNNIMSDNVPREYISYQEHKYREKYAISFPFMYHADKAAAKASDVDYDLHIGADDSSGFKDNLLRSLPSGYISGQNVNNTFSSLAVGYEDDINFLDLPIPFMCVATDMVSCRAKLWHSGKIGTALRSTMSIPGVFAPVKADGMVLVDGGMRNNFPADVAKDAGADIIIGVELSDEDLTYSQINNIGDLLWSTIDLVGSDSFSTNKDIPDVFIKPDLKGYNMMSFDSESIATIISRGYEAAAAHADEIKEIKRQVRWYSRVTGNKPAVFIGETPINVERLDFNGISAKEVKSLMRKLDLRLGPGITRDDVEHAVATLYGTGAFRSVTYELLGDDEPYTLVINCEKGPDDRLGLGFRVDSEELVQAIFNLGMNVNAVAGGALDLTARISSNPYADIHFLTNNARGATFNLDALFGYTGANLYALGVSKYNINYRRMRQRAYFSNINWSSLDVKLGVSNDIIRVTSFLSSDFSDYSSIAMDNDFLSAFVDARADRFDDGYFPKKGSNLGLKASYILPGKDESFKGLLTLQLDAAKVMRLSNGIHFIPSVNARAAVGPYVPVTLMNVVGGSMAGRYIDQQMPFIGVNYAMPVDRYAAVASALMRFNLSQNMYLSGIASYLASVDGIDTIDNGVFGFGAGVELAFDSLVGPVKFNVHWSEITNRVGAYFSLGYDF